MAGPLHQNIGAPGSLGLMTLAACNCLIHEIEITESTMCLADLRNSQIAIVPTVFHIVTIESLPSLSQIFMLAVLGTSFVVRNA
jgi:hypothetical protein